LIQDLYREAGVDFKLLQSLPKEEFHKHFTQEFPLTFRDGGNIPPIWAQSHGFRTKVIGLAYIKQSHLIVTREDAGIASLADLKGKRLSLPVHVGAAVDFWYATVWRAWETVLTAAGLAEGDVEFVRIEVKDDFVKGREVQKDGALFDANNAHRSFQSVEEESLYGGTVDAIYSYGGRATSLLARGGVKKLIDINEHPELDQVTNLYPNIATVREDFAEAHPEWVVEYLKAVLLAAEWAKTNKQEVVDIVARGSYVAPEYAAAARAQDFNQHLESVITAQHIKDLESQKDFLLRIGFIQNDFDVHAWVEPKFLEEAHKALRVGSHVA
jgi:2'-hydroxybiphenyl-2-sulfinate desulfinase